MDFTLKQTSGFLPIRHVKRAEHIHDAGGIFDAPNRLRPDYAEPWTSEHQKRYDRTLRVRDPQEKG